MAGETYSKRYAGGFVDGAGGGTPVDSTFLNAVETALLRLLGEDPAADEVGVWVPASGRFVFQKVTNAQIDAAAAIDKSKLGPLNIVNADISAGAAIAKSKLAALNIVDADVAAGAAINLDKIDFPAGVIVDYGGAAAPTGWLLCDGSAVSRTTYADLFAAIGTQYGAGDGSTTFNVPDFRGRVSVGLGTHADVNALGDNDGSALASRTPKHNHTLKLSAGSSGGGSHPSNAKQDTTIATSTTSVGPQTGAEPLDTPAYLVVNKIIKT